MTPRRITVVTFVALIYGVVYAISTGQDECALALGGVCVFLLVLYRAVLTPPLVLLADADLGQSGKDQF